MVKYLEDIVKAIKNGKFVIFVGSGISKNSGVPSWGSVIRQYAHRIEYPLEHISYDDYIKIPQYFYDNDDSVDHEEYYRILKDAFDGDYDSNILNDLIVSMKPSHIITTNYDHLLDDYGYEVIKSDEDLMKSTQKHYLIKMHGDIDSLDKIVFKESDYLNYSEDYNLVELYIKSLLIDHTFLFVGYSLNDYNLKLLLGWIDYLASTKKVKNMIHKNYLMTCDISNQEQYLYKYYENKNIVPINLNELPSFLEEQVDQVELEDDIGKRMYTVLQYIYKQL